MLLGRTVRYGAAAGRKERALAFPEWDRGLLSVCSRGTAWHASFNTAALLGERDDGGLDWVKQPRGEARSH